MAQMEKSLQSASTVEEEEDYGPLLIGKLEVCVNERPPIDRGPVRIYEPSFSCSVGQWHHKRGH